MGEKQVWAHSIQLLTELALISLRHLTGNLRPLKAVEEVIASPWLRQFFTLTFSLSVRVLPPLLPIDCQADWGGYAIRATMTIFRVSS